MATQTAAEPQSRIDCGIYRITCLALGWHYIGLGHPLEDRWLTHRRLLNGWQHHNRELQTDWLRFGGENFEFAVVEIVPFPNIRFFNSKSQKQFQTYCQRNQDAHESLRARERYWIAQYLARGPCYNQPLGPDRCRQCGAYRKGKWLDYLMCHCGPKAGWKKVRKQATE